MEDGREPLNALECSFTAPPYGFTDFRDHNRNNGNHDKRQERQFDADDKEGRNKKNQPERVGEELVKSTCHGKIDGRNVVERQGNYMTGPVTVVKRHGKAKRMGMELIAQVPDHEKIELVHHQHFNIGENVFGQEEHNHEQADKLQGIIQIATLY
jgi:hypothetical protein